MAPNKSLESVNREIYLLNKILSFVVILGILSVCASILLGSMLNPISYLYLLIIIPLFITGAYISSRLKKLRIIKQLKTDWGQPLLPKNRNFQSIKTLFDFSRSEEKPATVIDDQTWEDLNMNEIYSRIDRTLSDPGEAVLYRMLREPLLNSEKLQRRNQIIRAFQNNAEFREEIQFHLVRLGHQFISNDIVTLLWGDPIPIRTLQHVFTLSALMALFSLGVPFIWDSGILIIVPVTMFVINLLIHYISRRNYSEQIYSFPYLLSCIRTARTLSNIDNKDIELYVTKFCESYEELRKILKKARFLLPVNGNHASTPIEIVFEYLNIFFLLEVRSFYASATEINRQKENLQELYLALGELDALQSVASYRAGLSVYTEPEFTEDNVMHLEIEEGWYPLLENPVPASVKFNRNGVIITGSNMAGKSTFLRNIGCNVLLAQTIVTCTALRYQSSFFRIMSSISRTDDVMAGKSFYFIEAERILRTINSLDSNVPTLCIIDELLSGTNSGERLQASDAIIRYMIQQNTLVICATHDMELIERMNGLCDLYHFTGTADETGLKFDHQLKAGPATNQNAIELLEYLGYPKEITDRAKRK